MLIILIVLSVESKGVTSMSNIQGQEYVGLTLLSILALPRLLSDIKLEKRFMKLMWMGMSTYADVCRETIPKEEYDLFHQHKVTYLKTFKSV